MKMKFEVNDQEFVIILVEGECEMIHTKDQGFSPNSALASLPYPSILLFHDRASRLLLR